MAAEAAISTTVKLLGDLLNQKVNFLRSVKSEARLLKDELNRMQSFLADANKKQGQDERVRNWIADIREVALDTEDAIEMFSLNVENTGKRTSILHRCACFPKHLSHLDRVGEEIESIRARLDAIRISRETFGIKDLGEPGLGESSEVEARRRLAPWEKDENVVGVEDDVKKLLEPIMDVGKKDLWVTAVVGMGGIGKSTLAREVYNHPNVVSDRFDCRAWVVVSSEFNPQETIKQLILETTTSEEEIKEQREEIKKLEESNRDRLYLERKLGELLPKRMQEKTYFIVLDDVWEKEHWNSLMTAFPKQQDKTSRVLLTTRNKVIGNRCQSLHEMRFLDTEKSWELFLKKGLTRNTIGELLKETDSKWRDIVNNCKGLPLAITLIGGLPAETRSNRKQDEALNELNSHLGRAESSVSAILEAVLEMSYQNLSPKLKYCFLCLAFFKEDATIPVKRLVNIMVGQGLIQQPQRTIEEETVGQGLIQPPQRTIEEEIARGYLDELINKNMVQVKDLTLDNRVKSCQLHDSLRNICLKKAEEEIGLKIHKAYGRISLRKPRHCIIQCDELQSLPMDHRKHIRSLFLLNVGEGITELLSSYWKSFQHLKILNLDCDYYYMRSLPYSFRLLIGLKQLRIHTEYNCFMQLPTWLNNFKKLELLDMGALDVAFPNVELEMDNLRYIYASSIHVREITRSWEKVVTLKYMRQEDWMRIRNVFRGAELGIIIARPSDSPLAALVHSENLVKLHLLWHFRLCLDDLDIPQTTTLTKLKLGGLMNNCPSAYTLPLNLSHLTLEWSYLDEDPMQELSKLPKLLYLKLKNHAYMGERMRVLHDGFPSLRGLSLRSLVRLRSVDVEDGGMPQLELLQVDRCPALDTKNLSNKSYQLQILTNSM